MTGLFKLGAAAVILCLTMQSHAADIVSDSFEDGPLNITDSDAGFGSTVFDQSGLTGVIGGARRTEVQLRVPGTLTASLVTTPGDDAVSAQFQQSSPNPSPALPSSVTFIYGLNSQLNADLTACGNDRFRFTFTSVPVAESFLLVSLNSQSSGFADIKAPIPQAGVYDIPFTSFVLQSPGFSFSDVDRIDIRLHLDPAVQSGTYGLADAHVVPEPSAAGVAALAMLGRRRIRREVDS